MDFGREDVCPDEARAIALFDASAPLNEKFFSRRPCSVQAIAALAGSLAVMSDESLTDTELTATIGHSDSRTTKRIYGHLFPDSSATIAAKLDAYHASGNTDGAFCRHSLPTTRSQNDENPGSPGHS